MLEYLEELQEEQEKKVRKIFIKYSLFLQKISEITNLFLFHSSVSKQKKAI